MEFFVDFALVGIIIIFLTAFLGVIPNVFSEKVLARGNSNKFRAISDSVTAGWNDVGGNGKKRKKYY